MVFEKENKMKFEHVNVITKWCLFVGTLINCCDVFGGVVQRV